MGVVSFALVGSRNVLSVKYVLSISPPYVVSILHATSLFAVVISSPPQIIVNSMCVVTENRKDACRYDAMPLLKKMLYRKSV